MHDQEAQGGEFFVCNFCSKGWTEELPMVEGHRGSLICGQCLSIAYTEIVHLRAGSPVEPDEKCIMCLESQRPGLSWRSPINTAGLVCTRCVKQSAGVLFKDPDNGWAKPTNPAQA